ncbi:pyridoxamine 5'-phosphate oxidase family protein [Natronorarus salvus]|uniref:pyridoxamine 5'-phosphate oxidase family protein n=1 Tax=Natronorarus salvus TaxID=3117733 RepID=UPI002F2637E0
MSRIPSTEMSAEERDEFLGNGGTGVLSLATDGEESPHTVPVSYGYDASEATFYFRLAVGPDTAKGSPADRPVSFVTYGQEGGRWRSVVARGRLEATTEEPIETRTLRGLDRVHIPLFDVFDEHPRTVPFEFYRLVPKELTGRKETSTGD